MDELELANQGPAAVLAGIAEDIELDVYALGQACARRASFATSIDTARAWSEAGIACLDRAAATLESPIVQQSILLSSFGLRIGHILRTSSTPDFLALKWTDEAVWWLSQGLEDFESPASLLSSSSTDGFLVIERLRLASPLVRLGVLPESLGVWVAAASADASSKS